MVEVPPFEEQVASETSQFSDNKVLQRKFYRNALVTTGGKTIQAQNVDMITQGKA